MSQKSTPSSESSSRQEHAPQTSLSAEPGVTPPRNHRAQKGIFWSLVLASVLGCGWLLYSGRSAAHSSSLHQLVELPSAPEMLVTAEPVSLRPLKRTVEALGSLYGYEEIIVSSNVEGRVLRVLHDVSDRIQPDELLIEIDPADVQLEIDQLERNLEVELAKLGLEASDSVDFDLTRLPTIRLAEEKREHTRSKMIRMQTLQVKHAASAESVESAVSDFKMAEVEYENQMLMARSSVALIKSRIAALEAARKKLRDTQVKSPVPQRTAPHGGSRPPYVMTKRSIAEGSFVRIGDEICRLTLDDTLILRALLPEQFSPDVQVGQNVEVFPATARAAVRGTLTMINPAVDSSTRTFQVEIQVANDRSRLKPGGFARGVIELSHDADARTIPLDAMVQYAGVTKLFVIEEGRVREVQFTPGVQTADWVEVAEPLLPSKAVVVTSGQFALANGIPVMVRPTSREQAIASASAESQQRK